MPSRPTKGEVEAAIRNAVIKFEQEFMGRGPSEVKAYIMREIIPVRLKGVLTPAERQLAKSPEGIDMVRRMRQTLPGGRNRPMPVRPYWPVEVSVLTWILTNMSKAC